MSFTISSLHGDDDDDNDDDDDGDDDGSGKNDTVGHVDDECK